MSNYESPINIIPLTLRVVVEKGIPKAVYVDKDELIKTLTYYEKGFSDATPKWISIEERLPKAEENVLVTIKDDSADSPIYYTSVGWYYRGIWVVENEVSHQVIAWMPRPKPYKN